MTSRKKAGTPKGRGARVNPPAITADTPFERLIEGCMTSFNARSLRTACALFAEKIVAPKTVVGLSVAGALVPAGLGQSCLVPLVRNGFVDWISSTGANLYHDLQIALGCRMFAGSARSDDEALRDAGLVRIYDVIFEADSLFSTDAFIRDLVRGIASGPGTKHPISSADVHYHIGAALLKRNKRLVETSLLAAAAAARVPIHTPSPGDSGIGMNIAALALEGVDLRLDPNLDVNETAAYVYHAKRNGGKSAVVILGGGSPKNFMLQTEPYLQEVLDLAETGHDYFIQFTDARPDTGGLSGATPSEAVSWGKIDPAALPDTVVCYGDCSVYLPLLVRYALGVRSPRRSRKLYDKRRAHCDFMAGDWRSRASKKSKAAKARARKG
jgi:deoxyhypusine synthase